MTSMRAVELFVSTVEAGNFTRAASKLGLTPAAVSRAVARHEKALGIRLFRRTTRQVQLTDEGQAYFESCRQALTLLAEAERALTTRQATARGSVRLSVPTTYGHTRVLPLLARFRSQHPEVSVEVNVGNRNIDFVAEGYDLAIRSGPLPSSELVAHKLEDAAVGVFASREYVARHGAPSDVSELAAHAQIAFVRPSTGRLAPWIFGHPDGTPFTLTPAGALRCSDDFLGCLTLARAGAGLTQTFHFLVEAELAAGTMVEVLKPFAGRTWPFTLLTPFRRMPSGAVRALVEALLADARARTRRHGRCR
jgi:DNA-binding transcriptional LysR family regulator